jgi:hypothetical protein
MEKKQKASAETQRALRITEGKKRKERIYTESTESMEKMGED